MIENFDVEFEDYIIFHRGIKNFYIEDDTSTNPKHLHVIYQDNTDQDLGNPYGDYVGVAQESASLSRQYADGKKISVTEEGIVSEEDVAQGDPGYNDNSKYYSELSRQSSLKSESWAVGTTTGEAGTNINNSKSWALQSRDYRDAANTSAQNAASSESAANASARAAAASASEAESAAEAGVQAAMTEFTQSVVHVGTCSTAASTSKKLVTGVVPALSTLTPGDLLLVKFSNRNTASSPKIAFSSSEAGESIYSNGNTIPADNLWGYCLLVYQTSGWHLISSEQATNRIVYSETSAPTSAFNGMVWLKKKPTT